LFKYTSRCNANGYRLAVTVRSLTHRLKMMKNKFRQLEPLAATQPAVVAEMGERLWPALREVVHSEDAIRTSASEAAEAAAAQQQQEQQQLGKQSEAESMPHPTPLQLNEAPLHSNVPVSTAVAASASTTAPPPLPAMAPPHGGHGGHPATLLISSGAAAGGHGTPVHLNSPARPEDGGRQGGRMQAPTAPMYSQTRMGSASDEAAAAAAGGGGNAELGAGLAAELLSQLQRLSSQLLASEEESRRLQREMHAEKMKMLDTMIQRTEQSNARLLERVMDELAAARAGDRN
jgi:hypothetical protein